MIIDLSETDVLFIYGHFLKQLKQIKEAEIASGCPLDKTSIQNLKEPYLSVIEKLAKQAPFVKELDKGF